MWIIAGLGNPGKEYEKTRHNIGFNVVERLAEVIAAGTWKEKFSAACCEGSIAGAGKILLVKPLSFMNRSGEPLSRIAGFYKVTADNILVVHDEVDIPFGQLRIKDGGGDGGHNGIKSIRNHLGTSDFIRLRVGIGRPAVNDAGYGPDMSDWVLGRFGGEDSQELPALIDRSVHAVETVLREGVKKAQNAFN